MRLGHLDDRQQLFQQGGKLQFGEQSAESFHVGSPGPHGIQIQVDRHIAVDGRHALAEEHVVAVVLKRFAVGLLLDLSGAIERLLYGAEALDQFD
jgi:hypothetical protein